MAEVGSLLSSTLYSLKGRIALVTGGGTGIGLMIAHSFAQNGATVYISGRRKDVLDKVAGSFGSLEGAVYPLPMDVTNKADILEAVKTIETREGKLHILVNNSGQVGPVTLLAAEYKDAKSIGMALFNNESFEDWKNLYTINTFSIFFVTTAFLGLLAKGSEDRSDLSSVVINVTSVSGIMRQAQDHFAYNSSKAAASHLTKLLSTEIALKGLPIRVNAIAPGPFASEMTVPEIVTAELANSIAKGAQPLPAGRGGSIQEMAGTALYLASVAGAYTNGQEIVIDGGILAVNP